MLEKGWDVRITASAIATMTLWNTINYFAYIIIKNDSDEELITRILKRKNKTESQKYNSPRQKIIKCQNNNATF